MMAASANPVNEAEVRARRTVFACRLGGLLSLAFLTAMPASAQYAPLIGLDDGAEDDKDRHNAHRSGDFVIHRETGQLLLLDSRSGCVWSRTPPAALTSNSSGFWQFEFPRHNQGNCVARLNAALAEATRGRR